MSDQEINIAIAEDTIGNQCDLASRIAKLPDLERERDELREEVASLRLEAKYYDEADALRKFRERERDEARELVYAWESRWKAEVEFAAKVSVKRDELLDILRKLLEIIPEPECHDFGHTKEERHAFLEECPVMARYDALIAQAKEAAK